MQPTPEYSKALYIRDIKAVVRLYETGDVTSAYEAYDSLEARLKSTRLLHDEELLNLFLEVEFLIYEHGSTSLHAVQRILASLDESQYTTKQP